jgi:hypothetical protein
MKPDVVCLGQDHTKMKLHSSSREGRGANPAGSVCKSTPN